MPGRTDVRNTDFYFYGTGVHGVVAADATTALDLKITGDRWYCSGGAMHVFAPACGDYLALQLVDKDNILGYGANFVVRTFLENWYIPKNGQDMLDIPYGGLLPKDLYLRLLYTNTTSFETMVAVNYFFHVERQ